MYTSIRDANVFNGRTRRGTVRNESRKTRDDVRTRVVVLTCLRSGPRVLRASKRATSLDRSVPPARLGNARNLIIIKTKCPRYRLKIARGTTAEEYNYKRAVRQLNKKNDPSDLKYFDNNSIDRVCVFL